MKISIIGIGKVGSTLAFTLATRGLCNELVLVSRNQGMAIGDALDLEHAQSFVAVPTKVRAGNVAETANSDLLIYCASAPQQPSTNIRRSLGPANIRLLREILPPLTEVSPHAILLIVSNPVDVLAYDAITYGNLPPQRVLGTGTLIDSARYRMMLSRQLAIHPDDLRAYILGEHGTSQFAAMSMAVAGGEHIENTPERHKLFVTAREAGIEIYKSKGYTNYAIAMAACAIAESVVLDEKRTMPVSTLIDGYLGVHDVCLSVPVVVGRQGIERIFEPELDASEKEAFLRSAREVRAVIEASIPWK